MREVPDLLLGEPALGDVLMRRHPTAIRQGFAHDLDGTSVAGLDDHGISQLNVLQDSSAIFVLVPGKRSGGLSMRDDLAEAAARFNYLRRQPVHLNIALVAHHKLLRR